MRKIITTIIVLALVSTLNAQGSLSVTGDPHRDRQITYGAVGAAIGTIAGNNVGGDRRENRAIGAAVGTLGGVVLANGENRQEREAAERKARRDYERQIRYEENERRRQIALGRSVSDSKILKEEHEVEQLANEVARIRQERAAAAERARRIEELRQRKAELERELGDLRSGR